MERLENGLLLVLEIKNVVVNAKNLISVEKESIFVTNSRLLAQSTRELVSKTKAYISALPKDLTILFLADLLLECIQFFERTIVEAIQSVKVTLQNPLALSSFYASYNCSDSITKSLENLLWLSQLIDSVDTEAKYLLSTKQSKEREIMFSNAQKVVSNVKNLLEITDNTKYTSKDEKIEHFRSCAFSVSSSSAEFLSILKGISNTDTIREEFKGTIEGLMLFTKHIAQGDDESISALQQVRNEFVISIKNIVIFLHKSLNSELAPKTVEKQASPALGRNKRAAVRVYAGNNNKPQSSSRSIDISGKVTEKLDIFEKVLNEAENLYLALEVLENMKKYSWFNEKYTNESDEKKLLCIKKLHEGLSKIPAKSRKSRCDKIKHVNEIIILGSDSFGDVKNDNDHLINDDNNARGVLEIVSEMESSLDFNSMVRLSIMKTNNNISGSSIPRKVEKLRSKRLTLKTSTLIETICVFQAAIEMLLRAVQPEIPKKVELEILEEAGSQCFTVLEKILLLASMQKNEHATEPPPKLEQNLLQGVFQSLTDIPQLSISPDRDALKAIGRDGAFTVIRYLISSLREIQKSIEVITVQICSIVRIFQSTKDTSVSGILNIVATVNLFLQVMIFI